MKKYKLMGSSWYAGSTTEFGEGYFEDENEALEGAKGALLERVEYWVEEIEE